MSNQAVDILPMRPSFTLHEAVIAEVAVPEGATSVLNVLHFGEIIAEVQVHDSGNVNLGKLPAGGYGLELHSTAGFARTAIDVTRSSRSRLRYGFVASYLPDRNPEDVVRNALRLHLNGIQFYDWAYRHADLLGGGEEYRDALDQPISLATVRRLIEALHTAGVDAMGYAAVYAVGPEKWPNWKQHALLQSNGEPYALGDFLYILDPASAEWIKHFGQDLFDAMVGLGFDGFHLDQYGYPRRAARPDGQAVDVSDSFVVLIENVRDAVPGARLVFNNVNDFPTWKTGSTPQDAIYIEVWEPHSTLESLAAVATRARAAGRGKPVVIAAYQHIYDNEPAEIADLATSYTMATLFSHGATQLLAGEGDRILVDPYYVRNHTIAASTAEMLIRWYDFLVEHDELLLPPEIVNVTGSYVGQYNDALDLTYEGTTVRVMAEPGTVWRRLTETADGQLVLHVINLAGQDNQLWDGPKRTPAAVGQGTLRLRRTGGTTPRVRVADPDRQQTLREIPVDVDGDYATAILPEPHVWQLILIDL